MSSRPDFTVATLGELTTLYTADIAEGANVWVDADGAYWTLEKNSGAALGPSVIAPLPGAPSAGAANARWLRGATIPAPSGASVLTDIIYRPGAVGVLAPNVVATWAALMTLFNSIDGEVDIYLDTSLGATSQLPGVYDLQGRANLYPLFSTTPTGFIFDITDGAQIKNLRSANGFVLTVAGHGTVVPPLAFDGAPASVQFSVTGGAAVFTSGAAPLIQMAAGDGLAIYCDNGFLPTGGGGAICDVPGGATLNVTLVNLSAVGAGTLTGAGTIIVNRDTSVEPTAQLAAVGFYSNTLSNYGANYQFSALASLTTAVAQNVPQGSLVTDSTHLNFGEVVGQLSSLSKFRVVYIGAAGNVAGQTATFIVLINGVAVPGATVTGPTTAGSHVLSVNIPVPAPIIDGDIVTVHVTPSAVLTTALSEIMAVVN